MISRRVLGGGRQRAMKRCGGSHKRDHENIMGAS